MTIKPIGIYTKPITFKNNTFNQAVQNNFEKTLSNSLQTPQHDEVNFDNNYSDLKQNDDNQTNVFSSPLYKIKKAIKNMKERREQLLSENPYIMLYS